MARCIDCYFFKNPLLGGRSPKPCNELGETAQKAACENFHPKDGNPRLKIVHDTDRVHHDVEKSEDFKYSTGFSRIIADSWDIEQSITVSVDTINIQLNQIGSRGFIKKDKQKQLEKMIGKLAYLRRLHLFVLMTGLAPYLKQIMGLAIVEQFGKAGAPQQIQLPISPKIPHYEDD